MIKILDLGAGNIRSVAKALRFLGFEAEPAGRPEDLENARLLILPGVGAFGYVMDEIRRRGFLEPLGNWLSAGRPLLGICLGLQLLFEGSEESPGIRGFGLFRGSCLKLPAERIPHMGWNTLRILKDDGLFDGIRQDEFFYFAHSFRPEPSPDEGEAVLAVSSYGLEFPCVLRREAIAGFQFHPEKSGRAGLRLLKNWVERCWP